MSKQRLRTSQPPAEINTKAPEPYNPKLFSAKDDTSMSKHVVLYSERFFRLDAIRISKLLEIAQYAVISFWFNIVIGGFLDKLFPKFNPEKNIYLICLEITVQIFVLAIFLYYSKKLLSIIPFFLSVSKKYIPNLKNEMSVGMASAPLALLATQANLISKVRFLQSEIMTSAFPPSPKPAPPTPTSPLLQQ